MLFLRDLRKVQAQTYEDQGAHRPMLRFYRVNAFVQPFAQWDLKSQIGILLTTAVEIIWFINNSQS